MKINNEADFLRHLRLMVVGWRHSHLRFSGFFSAVYKPRDWVVLAAENKFFLRRGQKIIGEILSVDGRSPQAIIKAARPSLAGSTKHYLFSQSLKFALLDYQSKPAAVKLKLQNKVIEKKLSRQRINNQNQSNRIIESKVFPRRIGYLKIRSWVKSDDYFNELKKKIDYFIQKKIHALIIDLRGNSGGNSRAADALAGHFFDQRVLFGFYQTRAAKNNFKLKKSFYYLKPIRPYFDWRLYLLVDAQSFSATELFVAGLRDNERAVVIGETTGGGTGNPEKFSFIYKDLSFDLFVPTWIYHRPSGSLIEGLGVRPDILVKPKVKDILIGVDSVLARALAEAHRAAD